MTRQIWIPQHFTEAQADTLMKTLEKAPDLALHWVEALPAPAIPAPSKAGAPAGVPKTVLVDWLQGQGFEWNVRIKQANVKERKAMILDALNGQKGVDGPLHCEYHPKGRSDSEVLNATRKELRKRLVAIVQEVWGDPLVIDGDTPEQTLNFILGGN